MWEDDDFMEEMLLNPDLYGLEEDEEENDECKKYKNKNEDEINADEEG